MKKLDAETWMLICLGLFMVLTIAGVVLAAMSGSGGSSYDGPDLILLPIGPGGQMQPFFF